ncbi:MAG: LamG domain-containing protein, partial [Patescibacteria group bacterium]|nr:LamG domain-containing protein [Patescibacteria group bacterium]
MSRRPLARFWTPVFAIGLLLVGATAQGQYVFTDVADEASLVALWKLNEAAGATTVANATSASYSGTVVGTPTLGVASAMSTLGTAVRFSGAGGNRISVPYAAAINPDSYTIETWAQVQGDAGSFRSPLTSRANSPQRGYIFYAASDNTWQYWGGPGWTTTTGPSVLQDQWVHLGATYDHGSRVRTFYINGHPVATGTTTLNANTVNALTIGAGGDDGGSYQFNGAVDNVAVLNQALAHQNIANHYNAKSNYAAHVAASGPIAYWRLGEQAGTTAYNAVDVTKYAGTYGNVILRQTATAFADDIDTAASFANATAKVTVNYNADLNPADSFAVEAWARVDGGEGDYRTVLSSRSSSGGTYGFTIYANQSNQWEFRTGGGLGATAWTETAGSAVVGGQWAHVVGVYDATAQAQRFYVNGAMVASKSGVLYAP